MRFFVFLLIWSVSISGFSQTPNTSDLEAYFNILSEHNKFMGVVAIQQGETLIFEKAYGYRSIEKKLKNMSETSFRLGSISKTITATMVFQLIEEGKLDLTTKLEDYFPQVPNAGQITIHHLLKHQSGIYDSVGTSDMVDQELSDEAVIIWETIKANSPIFSAGTRTEYNHTNYWLLGKIIETIDQQSYAQSVITRINTISSSFKFANSHAADIFKNEAHSYISNGNFWRSAGEVNPGLTKGSASIMSRARDITSFYRMLLGTERILKKRTKRQLLNTNKNRYGAGIFELPYDDIKGYGHSGTIDGFRTRVAYFPKSDITVTILSNGLDYDMEYITATLIRSIQGEDIELPLFATIQLEEEQLKTYPGVFISEKTTTPLTISSVNGDLYLQAGSETPILLEVESETSFSFAGLAIEIKFEDLKATRYQRLILNQGGQDIIFRRSE